MRAPCMRPPPPGEFSMSALPTTMTAIEITRFGGPEVLAPATRPLPTPQPGEILIKVAAAGINRPDVLQRTGGYAPPPGASDLRSAERRVGQEGVSTCSSGWSPYHEKTKNYNKK